MNKKGFIKIMVIGIIILIIAAAGYFALMRKTAKASITNQKTETTNETADWKTYRNEKIRYEIKYPPFKFIE